MKKSYLWMVIVLLIPISGFSKFQLNKSGARQQCTVERRGPHGERIVVPVACPARNSSTGTQSKSVAKKQGEKGEREKGMKKGKNIILPKGFYQVAVDSQKGWVEISYHSEIVSSHMRECEIVSFIGDPKAIFGQKIGNVIQSRRPNGRTGPVALGVLNKGGQAGIARCLGKAGVDVAPFGLCGGGPVSMEKGGSIVISEPCGESGTMGGCRDAVIPPGGGGGASQAFKDQFMGPNRPGETAMSGWGRGHVRGSTPIGEPLKSGETRYTEYEYSEGGTTITSTTISDDGSYTVRETTCASTGGCSTEALTGNLITDDIEMLSESVVETADRVEAEAKEEREAREASTDDTWEDERVYARVERRGEMPQCDASGENCSGGGSWRVGFPIPTHEEMLRAIGNAAEPKRPGGGTVDCDASGETCGGFRSGGNQAGVALTNEMMMNLPGSGLVDPMGPDDPNSYRSSGGPSSGSGICSPDTIFWISTSRGALDCDMKAFGSCDNQRAFNANRGRLTNTLRNVQRK